MDRSRGTAIARRSARMVPGTDIRSKLWKNDDFLARNEQKWLEQKNEIRRMTPSSMSVFVMTSLSRRHHEVAAAMK
jgi:hypothetical protein